MSYLKQAVIALNKAKEQSAPKNGRARRKRGASAPWKFPQSAPRRSGRRRRRSGPRKGPSRPSGRTDRHESILTTIASKEIELEDAQRMYCRAARNAFDVQMPPIAHSRNRIVPFNFTAFSQVDPFAVGYANILFQYFPSGKGIVKIWNAGTMTSGFGVNSTIDASDLATVAADFQEARVGLGAIKVTYDCVSDIIPAKLYVGRIPSSIQDMTLLTPALVMRLPDMKEIKGNVAYVAWTPNDDQMLTFNSSPITTGPLSYDTSVFILALGCSITTLKNRLNLYAVSQCEGVPIAGATGNSFVAADVRAEHATWDIGATISTVGNFIWRASEAVQNIDPDIKTRIGVAASHMLMGGNRIGYRPSLKSSGIPDEKTHTLTIVSDAGDSQIEYAPSLLHAIHSNRHLERHLLAAMLPSDRPKYFAAVGMVPVTRSNSISESVEEERAVYVPRPMTSSTADLAQALRGLVTMRVSN